MNSQPSVSNFKIFSRSLEQFFLTVGQNNFDKKIPLSAWNSGFLHLSSRRKNQGGQSFYKIVLLSFQETFLKIALLNEIRGEKLFHEAHTNLRIEIRLQKD